MNHFSKRLGSLLCALCMAVMLVVPAFAAGTDAVVTIGDYAVDAEEFACYISNSLMLYGLDSSTVTEDYTETILSNATSSATYTALVYRMAMDAQLSERDAFEYVDDVVYPDLVEQYGTEEAVQEAMDEINMTDTVFHKLMAQYYYTEELEELYDTDTLDELYDAAYAELTASIVYGSSYQQIDLTKGYPYGLSLSGGSVNWEGGLKAVGWGATLTVVLIGLLVVFSALVLLVLAVTVFGKIGEAMQNRATHASKTDITPAASAPAPAPVVKAPAAAVPAASGIPGEVVAAIMAAITCMTSTTGKSYAIKRIRRTTDARSVWSAAGVSENTRPF